MLDAGHQGQVQKHAGMLGNPMPSLWDDCDAEIKAIRYAYPSYQNVADHI